jgi:hypothetical protein
MGNEGVMKRLENLTLLVDHIIFRRGQHVLHLGYPQVVHHRALLLLQLSMSGRKRSSILLLTCLRSFKMQFFARSSLPIVAVTTTSDGPTSRLSSAILRLPHSLLLASVSVQSYFPLGPTFAATNMLSYLWIGTCVRECLAGRDLIGVVCGGTGCPVLTSDQTDQIQRPRLQLSAIYLASRGLRPHSRTSSPRGLRPH